MRITLLLFTLILGSSFLATGCHHRRAHRNNGGHYDNGHGGGGGHDNGYGDGHNRRRRGHH